MKLYVKQKVLKILDHYSIKDIDDKDVYFVDQTFKVLGFNVNVRDRNKEFLFKIDRILFNFLPKYVVTFKDGKKIEVKERFNILNRSIKIQDYYKKEVTLKGNVLDFDFYIYLDRDYIGSIKKDFFKFFRDVYVIDCEDKKYMDLLVALMIIVDNIKDNEKNNG